MPRGKELEQLPMANIAPSIGDDQRAVNRTHLNGMTIEERPFPSKAGKDMKEDQAK